MFNGSSSGNLPNQGSRREVGMGHVFNPNAVEFVPGGYGQAINNFGSGQSTGSSSSSISRASQTIVTSDMIAKMIGAVYVGGRDENDDALMPSAQELRPALVSASVVNGKPNIPSGVALSATETPGNTGCEPKVSSQSLSSAHPATRKEGTSLVKTDIDKKPVLSPTKFGDIEGAFGSCDTIQNITAAAGITCAKAVEHKSEELCGSRSTVSAAATSEEAVKSGVDIPSGVVSDSTLPAGTFEGVGNVQKTLSENVSASPQTAPEENPIQLTKTARKLAKKLAKAERMEMGDSTETVNNINVPSSKKVRNQPVSLSSFLSQAPPQMPFNEKTVGQPTANTGNAPKTDSVALPESSRVSPTVSSPNVWAARLEAMASKAVPSVKPQEDLPQEDSEEQRQAESAPHSTESAPQPTESAPQPTESAPQPNEPAVQKNQKGDLKRTPNGKKRTFNRSPRTVRTIDEDGFITVTKRVPFGERRRKVVKRGPKKPTEVLALDLSKLSGSQPTNQAPLPLLQPFRPAQPRENAADTRSDVEDHLNMEDTTSEEEIDTGVSEKRVESLKKVASGRRSKIQKNKKKNIETEEDMIERYIKENMKAKEKEEEESRTEPTVVDKEEPKGELRKEVKKKEKPVEKEHNQEEMGRILNEKIKDLEAVAPPSPPPMDLQELRGHYDDCLKELLDLLKKGKQTWFFELKPLPKESRATTRKRDDKVQRFLKGRIEELRNENWRGGQQIKKGYESVLANYSSLLGPTFEELSKMVPPKLRRLDAQQQYALELKRSLLESAEVEMMNSIFVIEVERLPYRAQ
ncbi:hypothetical protein CAEBREN_12897 [Caenorhabditis brenneri]|uniref:Uncharacterized protein n=1 Tax=Caenorhabditis brenneri TaxID=135651 RepID=G0MYE8_CAEBE|nr:hypothetical protein CAEBREN_12897 [Caenorhabditis brenneri]